MDDDGESTTLRFPPRSVAEMRVDWSEMEFSHESDSESSSGLEQSESAGTHSLGIHDELEALMERMPDADVLEEVAPDAAFWQSHFTDDHRAADQLTQSLGMRMLLELSNMPRIISTLRWKAWFTAIIYLVFDNARCRGERETEFQRFNRLSRAEQEEEIRRYRSSGVRVLVAFFNYNKMVSRQWLCAGDGVLRRHAWWSLFGGPFCQIGKSIGTAVNCVCSKVLRQVHVVMACSVSMGISDMVLKMQWFLKVKSGNRWVEDDMWVSAR